MTQLTEIALSGLVGIAASLPPVLAIRYGIVERVKTAIVSSTTQVYQSIVAWRPNRALLAKPVNVTKHKKAAVKKDVKAPDHLKILKRCKKIPAQIEKQWLLFKAAAKHVESTNSEFTIALVLSTIFKIVPSSNQDRPEILENVMRWASEDPEVIQISKDENKTQYRIRELGGTL